MPFKSEAQHRKFRAMLSRGEISREKFNKWMRETKAKEGKKDPIKKLPERVKKAEMFRVASAMDEDDRRYLRATMVLGWKKEAEESPTIRYFADFLMGKTAQDIPGLARLGRRGRQMGAGALPSGATKVPGPSFDERLKSQTVKDIKDSTQAPVKDVGTRVGRQWSEAFGGGSGRKGVREKDFPSYQRAQTARDLRAPFAGLPFAYGGGSGQGGGGGVGMSRGGAAPKGRRGAGAGGFKEERPPRPSGFLQKRTRKASIQGLMGPVKNKGPEMTFTEQEVKPTASATAMRQSAVWPKAPSAAGTPAVTSKPPGSLSARVGKGFLGAAAPSKPSVMSPSAGVGRGTLRAGSKIWRS